MAGWQKAGEIPGLMPGGSGAADRCRMPVDRRRWRGELWRAAARCRSISGILGVHLAQPGARGWSASSSSRRRGCSIWYIKWIVSCVQVPGRPNLSFTGEAMTIVPWFFGFVVPRDWRWPDRQPVAQQSDDPRPDRPCTGCCCNGSSRTSPPTGSRSALSFSGSVWAYLGWTILAVISIITIIGWAWVYAARMRWICRNIEGTRREIVFNGSGLEFLWRAIVAAARLRLHHPDPVGVSLDAQLAGVADRVG